MNHRLIPWLVAGCAALALALGICFWPVSSGAAQSGGGSNFVKGSATAPAGSGTVVAVQTVGAKRGQLAKTVSGYGTVAPAPGSVNVVSVPYETTVGRIHVSPGEAVVPEQALLDLKPSSDAKLAFVRAKDAVDAAQQSLANVQRRIREQLATAAEEQTARQTLVAAEATLAQLSQAGAGQPQRLDAQVGGVVTLVGVEIGQVAPAGTPLLKIALAGRLEAQLGVEPEDAKLLEQDQPVEMTSPEGGLSGLAGTVRLVTRQVDATTRLVPTYIALPEETPLLIGDFVRGDVTVAQPSGLLVPRSAVLPVGGGHRLFTAVDGVAVAHSAKVILQTDTQTLIEPGGLQEGDRIIAVGNYGLVDGAAVSATPQNATSGDTP